MFWEDPALGRAGLLVVPWTLPTAPIPALQNPHREGFEVSSIARSLRDSTFISEEKHFLSFSLSILHKFFENVYTISLAFNHIFGLVISLFLFIFMY